MRVDKTRRVKEKQKIEKKWEEEVNEKWKRKDKV